MGNTLRKTRDGPVDGGATRATTPPTTEYDIGAVEKLILSKRLAPFYEGEPDASVEGDVSDTSLSAGEELKKEKRRLFRRSSKQRNHYEAQVIEHFLRDRSTECPICFLVRGYMVILIFSASQETLTRLSAVTKHFVRNVS